MPTVARDALYARLESSDELQEMLSDFHRLTGIELSFEKTPSEDPGFIHAQLEFGNTVIGCLSARKPTDPLEAKALGNVIASLARDLVQLPQRPSTAKNEVLPAILVRATKFLRENYSDAISLQTLSDHISTRPDRLSRLFRKCLGITFTDYLSQIRLNHCIESLSKTDKSVTEIAIESGFQSISQFNRTFKQHYGMSPRQYRSQMIG
jgi:AraC-like DNA-binding protein